MLLQVFAHEESLGYLTPDTNYTLSNQMVFGAIKVAPVAEAAWKLLGSSLGWKICHTSNGGAVSYLDAYDRAGNAPTVLYKKSTNSPLQTFQMEDGRLSCDGNYLSILDNHLVAGACTIYTFRFVLSNPLDIQLQLYPYKFMSDETRHLSKLALDADIHRKCFLLKSNSAARDETIRKALKYRYPVYYGRVMKQNYREEKLKLLHGYSTRDVATVITPAVDEEARFGICGPVLGVSEGILREDVWVLHVWGINFESTHTADYKAMLEGGWKPDMYLKRCNELYASIRMAASHIHALLKKKVHIQSPGIGLGAFMSAVASPHAKDLMRAAHCAAIRRTFVRSTSDWEFHYTDYEWLGASRLKKHAYPSPRLFEIPCQKDGVVVLLINAWDNRSFIGNGGAHDASIDGYMVSGMGQGKTFPNSSYTHNAFFAEHLYDADRWVRL